MKAEVGNGCWLVARRKTKRGLCLFEDLTEKKELKVKERE